MIVSTKSETIVLLECSYDADGLIYAPLALIKTNAYPRGDYSRVQQLWLCNADMKKTFMGNYRIHNPNEAVLKNHQMVNHVQFIKVENPSNG